MILVELRPVEPWFFGMKLADLAIEPLCLVTSYLHHLDIENLLFCGSRVLSAKLNSGGVAELEIYVLTSLRRFVWPSLFSQLTHLRRFHIENYYEDEALVITTAMLLPISRNLKELQIHVLGSLSALLGLLRVPGCLSVLETLRISVGDGEDALVTEVHWPPSLLLLSFSNFACRHKFNLDLDLLPPNLTILDADFGKLMDPTSNLVNKRFPETLTGLDLRLSTFAYDPIPLLPKGLKSLSIMVMKDSRYELEVGLSRDEIAAWAMRSLASLPSELTSLHLPFGMQEYSREVLEALPRTITDLKYASDIRSSDLPFAPPLLSSIAISSSDRPITKDVAKFVPKHMAEDLYVESTALPHLGHIVAEVSAVVEGRNDGLRAELELLRMETLPACITSLKIPTTDEWTWNAFPTKLRSLTLKVGITAERTSQLPHTLEDLCVSKFEESGSWKQLPPRLKKLIVYRVSSLTPDDANCLPCSLTSLLISNCQAPIPVEWYVGLPRGLKDIQVPLDLCTLLHDGNLSSLPPSLTTAWFGLIRFPKDETEGTVALSNLLRSLPRHLQHLSIVSFPNVQQMIYSPSCLALLPNRLETVDIPYSVGMEKEKLEPFLPRSLRSASLSLL